MLTVLFWNFNCQRPERAAIAASAALHNKADIFILADTKVDAAALLGELNSSGEVFHRPAIQHQKFQIFTTFPGEQLAPFRDDPRISIRKLRLPGKQEVLLAAIHYFDRRNYDRGAQHSKANSVREFIRQAENDAGHARTVIVGDFNMNPFDDGMIDTESGFGAMMSRELARKHSGSDYRGLRFYNPTWSRLGRQTPDAPGTYYWNNSIQPLNIFWHSLDQVLVRPALFDAFPEDEFRVLTSVPFPDGGDSNLIRETGKHWELKVSDHLPILFKLNPAFEIKHV